MIVAALGYAIYQEWQQHIISNTATAAAQAEKAKADACIARKEVILKTASMATIGAAYEQLRRDCAATVSEEVRAVASAKAKDGRLLEQLVVLHNEIAGELHDFDNHEVDAKTAFAFVQRIAMQIEAMDSLHTDGITSYTRDSLRTVGRVGLFAGEFSQALAASDRVTNLKPEDLAAQVNRAHALMFLERSAEAKAIYLAHKGEQIDGRPWRQVILDDFAEFRAAGITHSMMAEIEAAL